MGDITHIQWCNHTFNPWEGCTKVSSGCAHCYAETRNARFGGGTAPNWGKGAPRRRTSAHNWNEPRRWNRVAQKAQQEFESIRAATALHPVAQNFLAPELDRPHRPRVFCASLADWLDDEVPIEWLADLLFLIRATPNLDWLLLTKRPENWQVRLNGVVEWAMQRDIHVAPEMQWLRGNAPDNVWMGASVEDQKATSRIPELLKIPARVRFLSCEPLLEPVSLGCECWLSDNTLPGNVCRNCGKPRNLGAGRIDWVIIGGESGANARQCDVTWIRSLLKQCRTADVAPFLKQLGANVSVAPRHDGATGYFLELKHPKGGDMEEWPEDLRVREFPEVRR